MGRSVALPATLVFALALVACGRDDEAAPVTAEAPQTAAEAQTAAAPGLPADEAALPAASTAQGFLARAALSDMYEIAASQLVLERTQNADVRRYAQMMVQDHTRTSNEAQAAARTESIAFTAPTALDARRQGLVQQLRGEDGADLDERYIEQQVAAHEEALALMREYASGGDNAALKAWATRTAPMIENHLQMARAMDEAESRPATGSNP